MSGISFSSSASQQKIGESYSQGLFPFSLNAEDVVALASVDVQLAKQYIASVTSAYHAFVRGGASEAGSRAGSEASGVQIASGVPKEFPVRGVSPWKSARVEKVKALPTWRSQKVVVDDRLDDVPLINQEGFCYLSLVKPACRQQVADELGSWPTMESVMALRSDVADFARARELQIVRIGDIVHIQDAPHGDCEDLVSSVFSEVSVLLRGTSSPAVAEGTLGEYCGRDRGVVVSQQWSVGDCMGGDRQPGEVVFSTDPYGSRLGRVLRDPLGTVFHAAMHAASAAVVPPDEVVLFEGAISATANVGSVGRSVVYPEFGGAHVMAAAITPRIDHLVDPCVKNFRVVVDRPPNAVGWAVAIPSVLEDVEKLEVPGLEVPLKGPNVWIMSQEPKLAFDVSFNDLTALSFGIVDFKASFGEMQWDEENGEKVHVASV